MKGKRVTIVDYGVGNLLSARRAFEEVGSRVFFESSPFRVLEADRVVLPGVGAFGDCVADLRALGLDEAVCRFVETGRPLLGICAGMQMLLDSSEEFGRHEGLGLIPGVVRAIPRRTAEQMPLRVPHVGWSELVAPPSVRGTQLDRPSPIGRDSFGNSVYFVHSFGAEPLREAHRLADVLYGGHRLCAALRKDNVFGTQFHPEKGGPIGLRMVERFLGN